MITIKSVSKEYILNQKKVIALKSINLEFELGKLYAIMGHSGSGKSTLLHILGLLDKPTTGRICFYGKDIKKMGEKELADIRAKNIGFIFQSFYLNEKMKAYENVMLPMYINKKISKDKRKELATVLLDSVGLRNRMNHYPKQLSGGEQQRVAIARSLANNPNIIIADEPTGNLDEENEKIIFQLLKKISDRGKCVIVASHNSEIKKYADKIIRIENGTIMKEGD